MILQNDKWKGIVNDPRYEAFRETITEAFSDLVFEPEPHRYTLHGRELPPVSTVCHQFKEPFDQEVMAQHTFDKYHNDPRSKYYRASVEDIKRMWENNTAGACERGTVIHEFGEACFWFITGHPERIPETYRDRLTPQGLEARSYEENGIVAFWQDMPCEMIPILCETGVFSEEYGYAGTFDLLFYYDAPQKESSGFFIFDYKTNRELFSKYQNKHLLPPFEQEVDQPISIYSIQLSLYQLALQVVLPNIRGRQIVWLHPTGEYEKHELPDHTGTLSRYLIKS